MKDWKKIFDHIYKLLELTHAQRSDLQVLEHRLNYCLGQIQIAGQSSNLLSDLLLVTHDINKYLLKVSNHDIRFFEHSDWTTDANRVEDSRIVPAMRLIPKGPFIMGSSELDTDSQNREWPPHVITQDEYLISITPITNRQYQIYIQSTNHTPPLHWHRGSPSIHIMEHPVVNITFYDALAYCQWLSQAKDSKFRLPSEAEWEKAIRGVNGNKYPWGNHWIDSSANTREMKKAGTTPVNTFTMGASEFGVMDGIGNTFEWTISLWGERHQQSEFHYPYNLQREEREHVDASASILRVLRGSSYSSSKHFARCAARHARNPKEPRQDIGFRIIEILDAN